MKENTVRCLITAGATREFFDPVRYISNPSSGKMGYAIAEAAVSQGWSVDLVSGPVALAVPDGVRVHPVVTGEEMLRQVEGLFDSCDILIKSAAVCDFRPKDYGVQKMKKTSVERLVVEFEPVVDILKTMAARKRSDQVVVGFAAETNAVEHYARKKLESKNLDWIVANQVGGSDGGFGSDMNSVVLLGKGGERIDLGRDTKKRLAALLVEHFAKQLGPCSVDSG